MFDWDQEPSASTALPDYVPEDERASLIARLQALWTALGREMKARPDSRTAVGRWHALRRDMNKADVSLAEVETAAGFEDAATVAMQTSRRERTLANRAIKELRTGEPLRYTRSTAYGMIRTHVWEYVRKLKKHIPELVEIGQRHETEAERMRDEAIQRAAAKPVDDAWEEELKRRADLEADYPHWFAQPRSDCPDSARDELPRAEAAEMSRRASSNQAGKINVAHAFIGARQTYREFPNWRR